MFLTYVNSKHSSIKFTSDPETNNSLAFLDVLVKRVNNRFSCNVFRKSTFSGLGTSFFSFCCTKFKTNSVLTLLNRAYAICSNYNLLHEEFEFLKTFFAENGFQRSLVESFISRFLDRKFSNAPPTLLAKKKPLYRVIPYFGHLSVQFKIELSNLISEYFPHIDPHIILVNKFKVESFFKFKDFLPCALRSGIVYKYCCAKCASVYYGSSIRTLHTRTAEHKGISPRTGRPLVRPPHSSIRDHALTCNSDINLSDFQTVANVRYEVPLRITESIFILQNSPKLNDLDSAFPLKLFPPPTIFSS